jgi:hypothetical protein
LQKEKKAGEAQVVAVVVAVVILLWAHLSVNGEVRPRFGNMDNYSGIGSAIYQYISSGNNGHISIQHSVPNPHNKLNKIHIYLGGSSYEPGALTSSEFTDNMAL